MPRQSYTQTNQQRNLLKTNILQVFVRFFVRNLAKLSVFIQDKMQIISYFVFYKR